MTGVIWVVPTGDDTDAVIDEAHRVADLLGETGERPMVVAVGFDDAMTDAIESSDPDEAVVLVTKSGPPVSGAATVGLRVAALKEFADNRPPLAILAESTPEGDDIVARLAPRLGGGCVTDCLVRVRRGEITAGRAVYENRAYAELEFEGTPILSVNVEGLGTSDAQRSASLQITRNEVDVKYNQQRVRQLAELEIPEQDLSQARVIVAGGQGLGGVEGFEPVEDLADAVGGSLGASRPPADKGWVPYDRQIGVTGKEIEPNLYIPCAISGDPYHMRSVTAEHLIPINWDSDARIFNFADLGIVGDVFEYAPTISMAISEATSDDETASPTPNASPTGGDDD